MQKRMLKFVLDPKASFSLQLFLRLPLFSHLAPRVLGFGIRPEHVKMMAESQD